MLEKTQEKGLALAKDDYWLVETWKMILDHRREVLEQLLHELELNLDQVKEHRTNYEEYLKLMIDYDMPTIELDPKKINPLFYKKMENGVIDSLMPNFISIAFSQSEEVVKYTPKCTNNWELITSRSRKLTFQVLQSDIMEWNKLQVLMEKFVYTTIQKNQGKHVIGDEFLTMQLWPKGKITTGQKCYSAKALEDKIGKRQGMYFKLLYIEG